MDKSFYLYLLIMSAVTFAIRALPITCIRRELKHPYIRSFLYYIPYVTLAVMTFPAILQATNSVWSASAGFCVALIFAYRGKSLFIVSMLACLTVFFTELFL